MSKKRRSEESLSDSDLSDSLTLSSDDSSESELEEIIPSNIVNSKKSKKVKLEENNESEKEIIKGKKEELNNKAEKTVKPKQPRGPSFADVTKKYIFSNFKQIEVHDGEFTNFSKEKLTEYLTLYRDKLEENNMLLDNTLWRLCGKKVDAYEKAIKEYNKKNPDQLYIEYEKEENDK